VSDSLLGKDFFVYKVFLMCGLRLVKSYWQTMA